MTKEIALYCMKSISESERELCEECQIYGQTGCDHCYENALQYVITMLEQEPCDDCISRKAVRDTIFAKCSSVELDIDFAKVLLLQREIKALPPATPNKSEHCKNCKWWKDSDGEYRRGIGAESKCPINRREVMEGRGYCFMYEQQESEG